MGEQLSNFSAVLELFLNVLEFSALIVSAITFFILMLNQYSKALKQILGPCGIGFGARLRVLFLCRKSPVKKRAFLEFAILKTQGRSVLKSDWRQIIGEFKASYSEQSEMRYSVSNCTSLIGDDLSAAFARYFEFFSRPEVERTFGIRERPVSTVLKLHIEEAYATPTCLLTGLLAQYEENWGEFIKRYVSTAFITEAEEDRNSSILSEELYLTFAWLLWGPSYEISFRNYWAGLCQLSYGDESNSIPAVASHQEDVAGRLANRFIENEGHRYGALISADVTLFENKLYYKGIRNRINPQNAYFYDKVENGDLSFAVQIDQFTPYEGYKAKKYYCTAYVWLLFELEDEKSYSFRPEKSVAFFEHANLTDKYTYTFLIETLVDKSIKHFEKIFSNPDLADRKYRFICAMNSNIEEAFMERYRAIAESGTDLSREFAERLIPEPKRTPASVFASYDEYFSQNQQLTYEEVDMLRRESVSDLAQFYTEVYMDNFPDDDERESFDNLLYYLQAGAGCGAYRYHISLAKNEEGEIVGGAVYNYYTECNSGVIEFLAVKKGLQSSGIGTAIYHHVLEVLRDDAHRAGRGMLDYVFCEIDSPEHSMASIKKYLYFWDKQNYKHLDFTYVQPALSADQEPVTGLWLTVAPQNGAMPAVPGKLVERVIYHYMKYAMKIGNPEENQHFRRMKEELTRKAEIALLNIR